jgi:transglutaminase-like putative cysteine protease
MEDVQPFLQATEVIESDHPTIRALVARFGEAAEDVHDLAARLFCFARDAIVYNPYCSFFLKEQYRATVTLRRGRGYCVQKAIVLAALARAAGIPARLVFADIRNYRAPESIVRWLGTDLFVFHCYAELLLGERWLGATPAFDRGLCEREGFPLVEFDGHTDAILPAQDAEGRRFVEYVRHHGAFQDLPLELLLEGWDEAYGERRVAAWRQTLIARGEG